MTIAVSLCERYDPRVHDPVPHPSYVISNASGQWVDNVLVPLVQLGDDIPVSKSVEQEVSPVRDGQSTVNFKVRADAPRLPLRRLVCAAHHLRTVTIPRSH